MSPALRIVIGLTLLVVAGLAPFAGGVVCVRLLGGLCGNPNAWEVPGLVAGLVVGVLGVLLIGSARRRNPVD